MLDQLKDIDVSSIDELRSIKKEQENLRKRLDKMEEKRESVSGLVYERVHGDYTARYTELEQTARPLKDRARAEYAKLKALVARMTANLDDARLAKEELSFRHELGEFTDKEFKAQTEECDQRLQQCEAELKEGDDLKAKFIGSFHSEEELEVPGAPSSPAAPVPEVTAELPEEPPPPPVEAAAGGAAGASAGPEGARVDRMEQDATAMLSLPRLVAAKPDGTEEEYPLTMGTTTIGRLSSNDICIPKGTVSRYHARVDLTDDGFVIVDLESENGVFVNGEKVSEKLLVEGDRIEIGAGAKELVFRSA